MIYDIGRDNRNQGTCDKGKFTKMKEYIFILYGNHYHNT